MPPAPLVRVLAWTRASDAEIRTGLLGYLRVAAGPLIVDGITLRLTSSGRHALSFPARTDRHGNRHAIVQAVDAATREAIEAELLAQLGETARAVRPAARE